MLRWLIAGCCLVSGPVQGAEIYLCKNSQGATFWSSGWCNKNGGYTVDIVTVPNGMDFKEQARIGDQVIAQKRGAVEQDDRVRERARTCAAIDQELAQIWSRYSNWQFNENEQIGRDQTRTRELKAQRGRLGCQTR